MFNFFFLYSLSCSLHNNVFIWCIYFLSAVAAAVASLSIVLFLFRRVSLYFYCHTSCHMFRTLLCIWEIVWNFICTWVCWYTRAHIEAGTHKHIYSNNKFLLCLFTNETMEVIHEQKSSSLNFFHKHKTVISILKSSKKIDLD